METTNKNLLISLVISIVIHTLILFPVKINFPHFREIKNKPPKINFTFFAPIPQKQIIKNFHTEKIIKSAKSDKASKQKNKYNQREIKTIKNKKKSKAVKTPISIKDKKKILWDYALIIQKTIQRNTIYPKKFKDITETVKISFCIGKDGRLAGKPFIPELYRSRYDEFNQAAIESVIKASKYFPPLPEGLNKKKQYFDIVIEFIPNNE